ncbi:helix-turn-helix domain-containing protein [Actinomycetospora chibensis]|uniref:Helix-turn-helix domain-containing protein n=1 Tax=Actinomycetospora chibensis TaxID=663606 RepID=A0ABV9RQW2_9PSEU|nr:helix-turn-helix domain-containing protein [Actinomycetospora chibensis]MDD7925180.1 helix-turn-helix domain-containing protein [Actinomycetospora chibensis]
MSTEQRSPGSSDAVGLADLLDGRAQVLAREARRTPERDPGAGRPRLEAEAVPLGALERMCGHALQVAGAVQWAQVAVAVRGAAPVVASAGDVSPTTAEALARGPRAAACRSGTTVVVDDVAAGPRWTGLRDGTRTPASLLVLPLPGGDGALTLAAHTRAAFDAATRAVAAELARHVHRLLTPSDTPADAETAVRARDVVVAARALLSRHHGITPDAAFDVLLERATGAGASILACAEKVVDELTQEQAAAPVHPAEPANVRRALAYLEEHATEDVDVADVAAAAGLGTRGLQMAFRRWRATTPLAHLRDIRLAGAHEELLAADSRDGRTVADIASRWRFTHPGRFSVAYRRCYGCSPSETLRA